MPRVQLVVRDACAADAPSLVGLWESGAVPMPAAVSEAEAALARIEAEPGERVLVAERDAEVVGALYARRSLFSALRTEHAVHVSHLQVEPAHRRGGVATALMEAVVDWAEQLGAAHLLANPASASREANRFLARLGMSQVAVTRAAPLSAVRARLTRPDVVRRSGVRRADVGVVAQRRTQRRRLVEAADRVDPQAG